MKKKNCLNSKRLTGQEVQRLVAIEGKFHAEFTECFAQIYPTGYKNQPLVYELPENRFLFIFDPQKTGLGGNGDIYAGGIFFAVGTIAQTSSTRPSQRLLKFRHPLVLLFSV